LKRKVILEVIIEKAPDGVFLYLREMDKVEVNKATVNATGYKLKRSY
jgi:PAS domain-containing protein